MPTINGKGQASVFTREQLSKFFKVVKKDSEYWYCLFKFLYYSGERYGCVIQVKWSDINGDKDLIDFRSETRKQNIARKSLPLHPELKEVLSQYKKYLVSEYGVKTAYHLDYVFPGRRVETTDSHVCRTTVDRKLKVYLIKCGFENLGFSTHSFRRTFVNRLYEVNKNVKECMQITGHKSVAGFMLYVDINEERILETIYSL